MEDNTPKLQENELFEHHAFTVDKGQAPLRIDKYLMNRIENAIRNKIQAAAKSGNIYVNDVKVKSNYKVKPLDKKSRAEMLEDLRKALEKIES